MVEEVFVVCDVEWDYDVVFYCEFCYVCVYFYYDVYWFVVEDVVVV